jgi:hypothetical protein
LALLNFSHNLNLLQTLRLRPIALVPIIHLCLVSLLVALVQSLHPQSLPRLFTNIIRKRHVLSSRWPHHRFSLTDQQRFAVHFLAFDRLA